MLYLTPADHVYCLDNRAIRHHGAPELNLGNGLVIHPHPDHPERVALRIQHILDQIPYERIKRKAVKLPKRSNKGAYDDEAPMKKRNFVKDVF